MSENLCTKDEVKSYLKITDADTDSALDMLLPALSRAVEKYLGRCVIEREIENEPHDMENTLTKFLQLNCYPVSEVLQISCNGIDITAENLFIDHFNGTLKKETLWEGDVNVTYKAGICTDAASVPADLKLAVMEWIRSVLNREGNVKSQSLGDYSVVFNEISGLPQNIKAFLDVYKRYSV